MVRPGRLQIESAPVAFVPAQFDLSLTVGPVGERLAAVLDYDVSLFDQDSVERILAHLELVLRTVCREPDARIDTISLRGSSGELVRDGSTVRASNEAVTLDRRFGELIAKQPDSIALN